MRVPLLPNSRSRRTTCNDYRRRSLYGVRFLSIRRTGRPTDKAQKPDQTLVELGAKTMSQTTPQIYSLMSRIMGEIEAIEKGRKNVQQNYTFRGIDDVYAALHDPLVKHGVFYVPELIESETSDRLTKSGGTMIYTNLKVAYTFYAPDGSSVRAVVPRQAMDSGDKPSN